MSVKRSLNILGQQRMDASHMRSLESSTRYDFDELVQSLITSKQSYILRGLFINHAGAIGGAASGLKLEVSNSSVLHSKSNTSGTFLLIPEGTDPEILSSATNPKVTGSFVPNSPNYIGLEFVREAADSTIGQVYIWSPANKNETSKSAPLAQLLGYKVVISATSFGSNILPIGIVNTDSANNVSSIEDRRPLLFRLGTAGFNAPNPAYEYPWSNHTEGREENPSSSDTSSSSPFKGGDKQLLDLKEWMDAVMSSLKEIKGTPFWYEENAGGSITKIREDLGNTIITGRGVIAHDAVVKGKLNWTHDIAIKVIASGVTYNLQSNSSSTHITLSDHEVAYLNLVREKTFSTSLIFTNGSNIVESVGGIEWTEDLVAGDFVKVAGAANSEVYKVESVISTTQIQLTEIYGGSNTGATGAAAQYTWGTYQTDASPSTNRHIQIANIKDVPFDEDIFWLFVRDDGGDSVVAKIYSRILNTEIEQGETRQVSDNTTEGILNYVGMEYEGENAPNYNKYLGTIETTKISFPKASSMVGGEYFLINSAGDSTEYYVWGNKDNLSTDPAIVGKTGIEVNYIVTDTKEQVAAKYQSILNANADFTVPITSSNEITVSTAIEGVTTDAVNGDMPGEDFSIKVITQSEKVGLKNQYNYGSQNGENLAKRIGRLTAMMADKTQDKTSQIVGTYEVVNNDDNAGLRKISFANPSSGTAEVTEITLPDQSALLTGEHFNISDHEGTVFKVWMDFNGDGITDEPIGLGTSLPIDLSAGGLTNAQVATQVQLALNAQLNFSTSVTSNVVTNINTAIGATDDAANIDMGTGFEINITTQGTDFVGVDRIEIILPSSNVVTIICADEINLATNQVAYIKVDRNDSQTISSLTELTVVDINNVPLDEDIFIITYRLLTNFVYLWDGRKLNEGINVDIATMDSIVNSNVYSEYLMVVAGTESNDNEIHGPIVAGSNIGLPPDSRDGNMPKGYVVGKGTIKVYLNSQLLELGLDWQEVGTTNSESTIITISHDINVHDTISFRMDSAGGYSVATGGSSGGSGEENAGENLGTGADAAVYSGKVGLNLQFRRIKAGANMSIAEGVEEITISSTASTGYSNVETIVADKTLDSTNDVVLTNATAALITISLPEASTMTNKIYNIKKTDTTANNITITPDGAQTIDGQATLVLTTQYESVTIVCDGSNWFIL